jgi:hypothetical protein
LANAIWTDVATPTLTGGQTSPWTGTFANLAVQIDDNDAANFEGRAQSVTVTAGQPYTMHCYVKAGSLAAARLSLDGTTADVTGLSSTTWTLARVTDASSSGVSISAQALNGNTAASTGTVIWGGCQVELGTRVTAMVPTLAVAVTANADVVNHAAGAGLTCAVSTFSALDVPVEWIVTIDTGAGADSIGAVSYASGVVEAQCIAGGAGCDAYPSSAALSWPGTHRIGVRRNAGVQFAVMTDGVVYNSLDIRGPNSMGFLRIGSWVNGVSAATEGIFTLLQADPAFLRCSP